MFSIKIDNDIVQEIKEVNISNIMPHEKVIIDKKAGGVVPYLPLPELTKKSKGTDTQWN